MPDHILVQRCFILVAVDGHQIHQEEIIGMAFEKGGSFPDCVIGEVFVVASGPSRDIYSLKLIDDLKSKYFGNDQQGSIWLGVVNGLCDSLDLNGRITPVVGLPPELIQLHSSNNLTLHFRCDPRVTVNSIDVHRPSSTFSCCPVTVQQESPKENIRWVTQ